MIQPSIRRLAACDAAEYRRIRLAALLDAAEAFGAVHAVEAARPDAAHRERLETSIVFGAYAGGAIVGMVGLKREDGPKDAHKGFLWGFFVAPPSRRQGVGDALLRAAIGAARDVVEQITLAVVADSPAVRLYTRHGFVAYGVEPRALKDQSGYRDEILMCRFLAPQSELGSGPPPALA